MTRTPSDAARDGGGAPLGAEHATESEAVEAARRINAAMASWARKRLAIAFRDDETALHVGLIIENTGKVARAYLSLLSRVETAREEMKEAVAKERQRCVDIIQAARFDEIDRDFRAISSIIEGGLSMEDIRSLSTRIK